jgi:hypothetical protein
MAVTAESYEWLKEDKKDFAPPSADMAAVAMDDDTVNSMASTIPMHEEERTTTKEGSSSSSRDLLLNKFHGMVQRWMHLSVVMPSSSCVGVRLPKELEVGMMMTSAPSEVVLASFPLCEKLHNLKLLDMAVSKKACGHASHSLLGKRLQHSTTPDAADKVQAAADDNVHLWKKLLFGSSLRWFVNALGGEAAVRPMFANAYLNIQSISKPVEVSEAANGGSKAGGGGGGTTNSCSNNKCPPWALVRLAESDACMCSQSAMQVPFKVIIIVVSLEIFFVVILSCCSGLQAPPAKRSCLLLLWQQGLCNLHGRGMRNNTQASQEGLLHPVQGAGGHPLGGVRRLHNTRRQGRFF